MVGPLQRVLVCSAPHRRMEPAPPRRRLARPRIPITPPDFEKAQSQHETFCHELTAAGAEVVELAPSNELSLDAAYAHDASLATDDGLILMRPGKPNRVAEARHQGTFCAAYGVPTFGTIAAPGSTEAGDIVWLDAKTLLIGQGYRTNATGIQQMRALLAPKGVEVLSAPLPYGPGPSACLHLMSTESVCSTSKPR